MKHALSLAALLTLAASAAMASDRSRITGDYVEARTAEVFAGGCIMNSEAETAGRQAVLAWRVTTGSFEGVVLDGLTVVAAIAGERNLGMHEMGGEDPGAVRAVITVDARANDAQRRALVGLAKELTGGLITHVVSVETAPIRFATSSRYIEVSAGDTIALTVNKKMTHDPNCGAQKWFKPLSSVGPASMGLAEAHRYAGRALGTRWSAPNKHSAFYASFSY